MLFGDAQWFIQGPLMPSESIRSLGEPCCHYVQVHNRTAWRSSWLGLQKNSTFLTPPNYIHHPTDCHPSTAQLWVKALTDSSDVFHNNIPTINVEPLKVQQYDSSSDHPNCVTTHVCDFLNRWTGFQHWIWRLLMILTWATRAIWIPPSDRPQFWRFKRTLGEQRQAGGRLSARCLCWEKQHLN